MSSATSLTNLASELVGAIAPDLAEDRHTRAHVLRELKADSHGGQQKEWAEIKGVLSGLARTARIRVQDDFSGALESIVARLEVRRRNDDHGWQADVPINMSNIPQHIQLLLALSKRSTTVTQDFANSYLNRKPYTGPSAEQILFNEIMSDPFSGSHWGKGYDEEVRAGWTDSEGDEESTGSAADDEVLTPSSKVGSSLAKASARIGGQSDGLDEDRQIRARSVLEGIKRQRYWLAGGENLEAMKDDLYGWKDVTTLATTASLAYRLNRVSLVHHKVITSEQLQREIIFALSGRSGVIFRFDMNGICTLLPEHPGVRFSSPEALSGILRSFHIRISQISLLRYFGNSASADPKNYQHQGGSGSPRTSKTTQAFAEFIRETLEGFGHWIADLESAFLLGQAKAASSTAVPGISAATTPLLLKLELDNRYAAILDILETLLPAADTPTTLLNSIYASITTADSISTQRFLLELFIATATPQWVMLGDWLNRGMPIPTSFTRQDDYRLSTTGLDEDERELEKEFFLVRDRDVSWIDEEFWEAGYVLDGHGGPSWMDEETLEMVLEAGKARGLVKSLSSGAIEEDVWPSLNSLLNGDLSADISARIKAVLSPICQLSVFHLRRVLEEDCGLYEHLDAIDGLMYMRGFEVMEEWTSKLFERIGTGQNWSDFQGLTSGLRDVIESRGDRWMNGPAIRLSYARRSDGLDGVRASYLVPFPLSQLFTPTSLELRSQVFSFLLQLQYGRWILSSLAKASLSRFSTSSFEDRLFFKLRQQLVWFINIMWTWITGQVLDIRIHEYRAKLTKMTSLRAMISLELEHTRNIRDFCFLHESASEAYRAFKGILETAKDLAELVKAPEEGHGNKNSIPPAMHVQGRSKQRVRRGARRRSSSSGDENDRNDASRGQRMATNTGVSRMSRLMVLENGLQVDMMLMRGAIEELANAEGHSERSDNVRETWNVLFLALEDWK